MVHQQMFMRAEEIKCEYFKQLAEEKRQADIRFLAQNNICPIPTRGVRKTELGKGFKKTKLNGNYLGFTVTKYVTKDRQILYDANAFKNHIVADGVPLALFSVVPVGTVVNGADPELTKMGVYEGLVGLGCLAILWVATQWYIRREAKRIETPYFSSLTELMDYVYRMVVTSNPCPTNMKVRG